MTVMDAEEWDRFERDLVTSQMKELPPVELGRMMGVADALLRVLGHVGATYEEDGGTRQLQEIACDEWGKHAEGKCWSGTAAFGEPTAAASVEDGLFLYSLVRAVKPEVVVEVGTHEELFAKEGLYRRLCELQFREPLARPGRGLVQ